ncbi:MAG: glycosyltransferase family 4 protein [Huintestinicola sp.]
MKIAVNIQPMLHSGKSGIGFYEQELLKAFFDTDGEDSFLLQYFDPKNKQGDPAARFGRKNVVSEPCKWFSATLYQLIWTLLPIPYRLFFKSRPDVTMFFNYYLPPFAGGKKLLVVYDTVVKDYPETMSSKTRTMLNLTLKRSIKRADKIITISEFSKQQIVKHYNVDPEDIVIIPCAADEKKFFPMDDRDAVRQQVCPKYDIKGKYYLYLGNLEPRKNIARLIEAYGAAVKKQEGLPQLVIAGGKGWQYDEIFGRVKELQLSDRVIFTGYVDDGDVPLLMNGAEAFCFPSIYEGFGMPPLEAMSCGVPVIVSDTSSLPEVVGDCGISVDPYDTDAIADALIRMTDKEFTEAQRIKGIERAKDFSWKKSAGLLKSLTEELV